MQKTVVYVTSLLLLLALSALLLPKAKEQEQYKRDWIELSKAKYGFFNAEAWKDLLIEAIKRKSARFAFDEEEQAAVAERINPLLENFVADVEENYPFGTELANFFFNIKGNSLGWAQFIVKQASTPDFVRAIQSYTVEKIEELAASGLEKQDYAVYKAIVERYGQGDAEATKLYLAQQLELGGRELGFYQALLLLLGAVLFVYLALQKELLALDYSLLTACSVLFLLLGLYLPMIEIDARLTEITLYILDEPVEFRNQVLYYRSKSILDVVYLMLASGKLDLVLVALLIGSFSVLFPLLKLLAQTLFVYAPEKKRSKLLHFFAFDSSKWSMADVFVVAIFMAYIGFASILSEQLAKLDENAEQIEILSTNNTALLWGFYCFLLFALVSNLLSMKLKKRFK